MNTKNWHMSFGLLLAVLGASVVVSPARELTVDPRNPSAYRTLARATADVQPGDMIVLSPGSGPYRETLNVAVSGTAGAPIVIEGNGNEITGYDLLTFTVLPDGRFAAPVKGAAPFALRHNGRRVKQEASSGIWEDGIVYESSENRLVLPSDASIEDWEISVRELAVKVNNVSHQVYRGIVASGARNDGFNLHGDCVGMVFENIVGCQNLDEGFSSHETAKVVIRNARFYENDNGLLNGFQTQTQLERVDAYDNLGIGVGFTGSARVVAVEVRSWGNGMSQLLLRNGVSARFDGAQIYPNGNKERPWMSYKESANWAKPVTLNVDKGVIWDGPVVTVNDKAAPQAALSEKK